MLTSKQNRVRNQYLRLKQENPFKHKYYYIKIKANRHNIKFDLTPEYLESIWTGKCAVSGQTIYLYNDRREEDHAELDRTDPSLGYVKGNVAWLSRKYNRKKGDLNESDIRVLANYLQFISMKQLKKEYTVT